MGTSASDVTAKLKEFTDKAISDLSVNVAEELISDTPVLTGFAQSNWLMEVGSEAPSSVGSKEAVNYSPQAARMLTVAATYRLPEMVYITNPVDYINALNSGSSAQAPAAFVQSAIAKGIQNTV